MQLRLHKSRVLRPHHIREGNRSVGHQYGSIAAPLTQLFELGVFKRNDEAQKAFEKLQDTTMTLPVLALLDFNIPFEVETNASGYGIGAVLMQNHRPIAFYSHTLALRDRAKPVFERKLMAVSKESSNRSIKRIAKLLGYSFEVVYKLGSGTGATFKGNNSEASRRRGGEELLDATWHASVQGEDSNCQTSSLIPAILHTYHDSVFRGHSGFLRTYKRSTGQLYWEGMKSDIQKYCEECVVCQRNKSLALTPAGLLLPLEIPNKVWNDISMDFIEGLPKAVGYETVADLFVKEIVRLHGFPQSIVSDRDKIFLSHFWKELVRLSGTQLNRSTAYHPQTDGQIEVVNKSVESYL
ncbi:transposon Tf2-1 polyprotein isoform X1 [Cucumis melo var. makuwa]|uniref:Transposon Tf2-1 polyprotein isoform X1 n=1 Tax=Cucumis melo var. makuwa TaxID=1194695 RepID=A0A5D3C9G8_CUCMM|nr:transposon Tf2-1 polyprotein isoform X1 [Cucumis melo var. makuwa]